MHRLVFVLIVCLIVSCSSSKINSSVTTGNSRTQYFPKLHELVKEIPKKENVWVFVLAGQSNMAGRGLVEPQDTVSSSRILTINAKGELIVAKEPLHFYEPTLTGLDCGLSFGKTLIQSIPDSISVLLLPTAIGGSSISQWIGDSTYRNVQLLSNFREKITLGKKYGQVKAILWHQGESDAHPKDIPQYQGRLSTLFQKFRTIVGNETLPILMGELGTYSKEPQNWQMINEAVKAYATTDRYTTVISNADFKHKGDNIHFNSEGQRFMGQRFATAYLNKFKQ